MLINVQVTLDSYASVADEMLLKNVKDLKVKLNEPQANITSDVVVSAKVQEELVKQARNQNMN